MIKWRLPQVCDMIHREIIYPRDLETRLKRVINDIAIRNAVSVPFDRNYTYQSIRKLDAEYRSRQPLAPTWEDVPVFEILQKGGLFGEEAEDEGNDEEGEEIEIQEPQDGTQLLGGRV